MDSELATLASVQEMFLDMLKIVYQTSTCCSSFFLGSLYWWQNLWSDFVHAFWYGQPLGKKIVPNEFQLKLPCLVRTLWSTLEPATENLLSCRPFMTRWSQCVHSFGRGTCILFRVGHKNRVECAVRGFKLRFTSLSIDRPRRDHAFIDGPVTGLGHLFPHQNSNHYHGVLMQNTILYQGKPVSELV